MALSLEPGYLDFDNLPDTNFTCVGKVIGGYYADLEANCQMFHVCTIGQADEPMDIRFLCLNGTVFDQETRVCERIDEVDCSKSEHFYSLNLELYGNSGPILEESPEVAQETEPPSIIIKSKTSTTTTTTTTTKRPSNRPATPPYYNTIRPHVVTTPSSTPKVVSTHHFPVNAPDIRFNPEEINISLNPGAPPDIRTKHFLQQSFSDISQDILNDNVNSDGGHSIIVQKPERLHVSSSSSPKSIYAMDNINNQKLPQNNENNFGFLEEEYLTDLPHQRQQQFLIQTNSFRHSQSFPPNVDHNSNQYHHQHFHSTTAKPDSNFHQDPAHTTLRTIYLHSLKPPEIHQHHHYTHHHRTEKPPHRVQIPIPLLPTLPPLTFSSPAPFTLQRHIETKRYTKDHPAPPRIIISASASVSDASGRRLNYSLGTIGAAQILKAPPASYDDYKDSDVSLDPFYHDVPKLNKRRRKRRSAEQEDEKINPFDIIKDEKEAVEVLKFLFTWYQGHQATATVPPVTSPITPDLIHKINYEFAEKDSDSTLLTDSSEVHFTSSKESTSTESLKPGYKNNDLFKKNGRYSIIGGYRNLDSKPNSNNKTFKNSANSFAEKHADITRTGKNLEVNDLTTEIVPDLFELKEKMDDSEVTDVKDLKEAFFNPYDYVDDNYEGEVYKEYHPNVTKEENNTVYAFLPKEKEDIQNETNRKNNFSVNPVTITELYKYFNVNRDVSEDNDTINTFSKDIINSKTEGKEYNKLDTTYNKNKEIIESKESVVKNLSSPLTNIENLNESVKFTEINVLSEVHENDESLRGSSTTSTTTEEPSSRRSGIRRGRGRQRQHTDNYYDRQQNTNGVSSSIESRKIEHEFASKGRNLENTDISKLNEQSFTTRSQNKPGRSRGRSRFANYYSSTSTTTTTVSSIVENVNIDGNDEENPTIDPPLSTVPTIMESTDGPDVTLEILNTAQTLKNHPNLGDEGNKSNNNAFDEDKILKINISEHVEDNFSGDGSSKNIHSYDNNKYTVHNMSDAHENNISQLNDFTTENYLLVRDDYPDEKNISSEKVKSDFEMTKIVDSEPMQGETSTITFFHEENNHFTKSEEPIVTTITSDGNHILDEATTETLVTVSKEVDHTGETKDTQEFLSELKPAFEITKDASYLIKLLRYFAETELTTREDQITTEIPSESYTPLTESQVATTEKPFVSIYRQGRTRNRAGQHKRGRQGSEHWHPPRVITTNLPTLKDIFENSNRSKIKENEIKQKNFKIAVSIENLLDNSKMKKNESEAIIHTTPANTDFTTKFNLKITDLKLKENEHIKTKSELLQRLTLIEQNLPEDPNINLVTTALIADTTVTTPYDSFEQPESYGTTIPSVTDPTKSFGVYTEQTKDLTQMFEISTESNHFIRQSEPTRKYKNFYNFYDDVFVVPEFTEKSSYTPHTEADKNTEENKEAVILKSTLPATSTANPNIFPILTEERQRLLSETREIAKLDFTSSRIQTVQDEAKTPPISKPENDMIELINTQDDLRNLDLSTLQPDVEIQKSISLPVSILETTFDISHDINNAQDINNLLPPISETSSTLHTTENLQEYILEIEASTKSVVAKDDQVKLGFTEGYGITATETVPTTVIRTETNQLGDELTTIKYIEEHINNPKYSLLPEVQENVTEILFVKDSESSKTSNNDSTTSVPINMPIESPGMVNSSHLLQVEVEVEITTTEPVTTISTTTRTPYHTRRTRPPNRRPYNNHKNQFGRHRFSTELFTNKPPKHSKTQYKPNSFTSPISSENITDAPLHRSATPTRSELKKVSLHTTPLSSKNLHLPSKINKSYVFNCFGKDKNKFYADPRDCRLFHYCTQGYSKNQLLDLKFVCDQKTFFDDEKLLCTKVKPTRCL